MQLLRGVLNRYKLFVILVTLLLFLSMNLYVLGQQIAFTSIEAETSTNLINASAIADSTASGGAYVQFNTSTPVTNRFPVAVDSSSRYLIDQSGDPWLGVGDTAWSLIAQLNNTEIASYLDNRAAKGVNYVLISAPEPFYADKAPGNTDNVQPFTGTPFQSALNDTYWKRVDYAIDYAASRGITFIICPMYTGYSGDGWEQQLLAATNAQMTTYGNNLASRYGTKQNIMWVMGHDKQSLSNTLKARGKALADALQANTPHLVTAASNRSRDNGTFGIGSEEWAGSGVSLDLDTQYDYSGAPGKNAAVMWSLSPAKPFVFFEGIYEQEQPGPLPIGDGLLREELWGPFVNGATAVLFGNNPIWGLGTVRLYTNYSGTWQQNMDYPGSQYLAKFAEITKTFGKKWGATSQDATSTFVTNQGSGATKVSARFSKDFGIVYHPFFSSGTLNLDLTEFGTNWTTVTIKRYDPASGAATTVGTYNTTGTQSLSAPSANSKNDRDWVYVVEGATLK